MASFRWVVGVDLSAHCHGALRFADWLHRRTRALGHRFHALHVIEKPSLTAQYPGGGSLTERALELTHTCAHAVGAHHAIRSFEIARADLAADELAARASGPYTGIIIGRAGVNEGWSPVSIGGTARALMRSLPAPVFVVPPDLAVARLDPGPIVVSLETDASGVEALRFASTLAREIGRPVVGVVAGAGDDDARERIERWCGDHHLPVPGLRIAAASAAAAVVVEDAEAERACMVVCGATRLTMADRSVHESVGTRLAALASCPVLVVPPHSATTRRRAFADRLARGVDIVPQHFG